MKGLKSFFIVVDLFSTKQLYAFLASLYVNCFLGNQQKRYKFHTVIKKKFESDWRFFQKFILMVKTRNQDFKNSKQHAHKIDHSTAFSSQLLWVQNQGYQPPPPTILPRKPVNQKENRNIWDDSIVRRHNRVIKLLLTVFFSWCVSSF